MFEGAADRARVAVGQRTGELGRHAVEPALPQVEQVAATVEGGGAQVAVVRRQPLGAGEVVLGRVEHRDPGAGGVEQQLELGHPSGAGGPRRDLGGELFALDLGLGELGPDALGLGRELGGAVVELGVLAGAQRLVVGLPRQGGGGAVERQQPGEHLGHVAVGQRGERAGGEGVAGCARPERRQVATSSVARARAVRWPARPGPARAAARAATRSSVARPGGLEARSSRATARRAAGAQVVEGAGGGQGLRRGPLGPGCRVEGGHRRAHPGVEPVGDGAQVGADRLGGHLGRARDRPPAASCRVGEHVLDAGEQALPVPSGPLSRSAPAVRRASASQASTSAERGDVEEPLEQPRGGPRAWPAGSAAKSPWGSSTTLANCAIPMPRASLTTSATSSWRVLRASHRPPRRSSSVHRACTDTTPVPRFLGRRNSGERVIRNRRVPAVSSSVTRGHGIRPGVVAAQPALGA